MTQQGHLFTYRQSVPRGGFRWVEAAGRAQVSSFLVSEEALSDARASADQAPRVSDLGQVVDLSDWPRVATEFVVLSDASGAEAMSAIDTFASQWGPLGTGEVVRTVDDKVHVQGESLESWQTSARELKTAARLWALVRDGRTDAVRAALG